MNNYIMLSGHRTTAHLLNGVLWPATDMDVEICYHNIAAMRLINIEDKTLDYSMVFYSLPYHQ